MFETKDSGERSEYASGMVRDTEAGKPRFDLLLPLGVPYHEQMLTRFAELMARGAGKYSARNWELAEGEEELRRYHSSAMRHLVQWVQGETDEDHAAAVMFNIMAGETVKYKMRGTMSIDEMQAYAQGYSEGYKSAASFDEEPADSPFPETRLDGTFENVCGNFNDVVKGNCLRSGDHKGGHIWVTDKGELAYELGPVKECENVDEHTCIEHPEGWPGRAA